MADRGASVQRFARNLGAVYAQAVQAVGPCNATSSMALQEYGQNTGSKSLSTRFAEHFELALLFFERHLFERVGPSKAPRDRLHMVRELMV